MAPITLRGTTLDPNVDKAAFLKIPQTQHVLVQLSASLDNAKFKTLQDNKLQVEELIDPKTNTYLCWYQSADYSKIKLAFAQVVPYVPAWKISADIKKQVQAAVTGAAATEKHFIGVGLHAQPRDSINGVQESIRALNGPEVLRASDGVVQLKTELRYIDSIAAIDNINGIEELLQVTVENDHVHKIVAIDRMNAQRHPALEGEGQVIAVTDTGIDPNHHAFAGRIKDQYYEGFNDGFDTKGHGTHVAATVLGDGKYKDQPIQGAAPKAQLVVRKTDFTTPASFPPPMALFLRPYLTFQAKINNNSWAALAKTDNKAQLPYGVNDALNLDTAANNFPDLLIVLAAGNEGYLSEPPAQIQAYASAKNAITVGASMTDRPVGPGPSKNLPWSAFLKYDRATGQAINISIQDTVAAFSSKGPTVEGRLKPDVVAPGVAVLSARSKDLEVGSYVLYKALYGASDDDSGWIFMDGTSMAAPSVSGCAALLREALLKPPVALDARQITSALLKALLINGAQFLPTGDHPRGPNIAQGFGRINMETTIRPLSQAPAAGAAARPPSGFERGLIDAKEVVNDAKKFPQPITLVPSKATAPNKQINLKCTLAFIDSPGKELQSALMLTVGRNLQGQVVTKYGFEGLFGVAGAETPQLPSWNNVQQILVEDVDVGAGNVTVTLQAVKQLTKNVHWAVVWDFFEVDRRAH